MADMLTRRTARLLLTLLLVPTMMLPVSAVLMLLAAGNAEVPALLCFALLFLKALAFKKQAQQPQTQ